MTPTWFRSRGFLVDADFARDTAARQFSASIMLMVALAIGGGMWLATQTARVDTDIARSTRAARAEMMLTPPIAASVRYVDKPDSRYQFGAAVAANEH